ncbi:hypothetical protein MAR_025515, partial [Mya arenaria]
SNITVHSILFYHLKYTQRVPSLAISLNQSYKWYLLVLAGDIALNPGPTKHPCGVCNRPVASSHRAVECEACYQWIHIKCANITPKEYILLGNSSNPWVCNQCENFHFTDSFFSAEFTLDDPNTSIDFMCSSTERCLGGCKNKDFWSTIKPYMSNKSKSNQSKIILNNNEKIISVSTEVAEVFNEFYANVAKDIGKDVVFNEANHPSISKILEQNITPSSFNFTHVGQSTVSKIIQKF